MSGKVLQIGDADFDSAVLNSKEPVLVDFWAEWSGPSKMIAPALDELADAYEGRAKVAKVNVDDNRALAAKYHVRSLPYVIVFKDGEKVGEQIGAVGKAQLAGLLDRALT
ncbi:thioredoxin [Nocardia sp. NPDC050435]|uniref:thioredoxin n=1 Tax=Nocardia sp. NPDC050435 TaxID=3155040 RepID=UPI0033F21DBB